MTAAGAAVKVIGGLAGGSEPARLPAHVLPDGALLDPVGGVIDVDAVPRHLVAVTGGAVTGEQVDAIELGAGGATVRTPSGSAAFAAVAVTAGMHTRSL